MWRGDIIRVAEGRNYCFVQTRIVERRGNLGNLSLRFTASLVWKEYVLGQLFVVHQLFAFFFSFFFLEIIFFL